MENVKGLINVMPIRFRIQSHSKDKPSAMAVAYITSRDVMNHLDKYVGAMNWTSDYKMIDGKLYGGIGIYNDKINDYVWKWDCGTESKEDKEKGQASDAFKRAAVKWGVGRFLYEIPIQFVKTNKVKAPGVYPYPVDNEGNKITDLSYYLFNLLKRASKLPKDVNLALDGDFEEEEQETKVNELDNTKNNKPVEQPKKTTDNKTIIATPTPKKEVVTSEKVTNIDKKTSLIQWTEKHLNNATSTKDCLAVKAKMQEKNPKFIDTEEFKNLFKSFYNEFDIREKTIEILDLAIKNKTTFISYVKQLEASNPELEKADWFQDHVLMLSVDHKVGIDQKSFKRG